MHTVAPAPPASAVVPVAHNRRAHEVAICACKWPVLLGQLVNKFLGLVFSLERLKRTCTACINQLSLPAGRSPRWFGRRLRSRESVRPLPFQGTRLSASSAPASLRGSTRHLLCCAVAARVKNALIAVCQEQGDLHSTLHMRYGVEIEEVSPMPASVLHACLQAACSTSL